MQTLSDLERSITEWTAKRAEAVKRHAAELQGIDWEIEEARRQRNLLIADLDPAKILLAEHVIYVRGTYANAGEERHACLEEAVRELSKGGGSLRAEYCGTKSYDRWYGQRSNHAYGMGPRHGSIIFVIGLTDLARKRDLSAEETDAAIYYLRNIVRIQSARENAKAA